ncbi:MAG TPA: hypothetical protein VHQ03_08455, partial [Candidatus Dormibacteraeota bacterium]|nr:hypothetical protein [Candidatus Dormibacteraeota bacterium]
EYLLVHRGMRGQSFEYELLFDGAADEHRPHLAGLIDTAALASTTASSRGSEGQFAGPSRPQRGPIAGSSRPGAMLAEQGLARLAGQLPEDGLEARPARVNGAAPSYAQAR